MNNHQTTSALFLLVSLAAAPTIAPAVPISGQGTWETTLQGRDLDGNDTTIEAYYDTTLDITWLANANYGMGSTYDATDGTSDGRMDWETANAWAASLNPYGSGITGWRLPITLDPNPGSYDCNHTTGGTNCGYNVDPATSEMAHMHYVTLGNIGYPSPGWEQINTANFIDILVPDNHWSATADASYEFTAWNFTFYGGMQAIMTKDAGQYAWAVHDGDIGVPADIGAPAIPVPPAAWLFGSGLLGLFSAARFKVNT